MKTKISIERVGAGHWYKKGWPCQNHHFIFFSAAPLFLRYYTLFPTSLALLNPVLNNERALINQVQEQTFRYMWDAGDARTGMAYEASFEYPNEGRPLAVGGTGFGIAAIPAAVERGWISRSDAVERMLRIATFLRDETQRLELHGAFPHWLHNETGKTIQFSDADDGADLVETALLMQGLLIARAFFDQDGREATLRSIITTLYKDVDWQWFSNQAEDGLFWHWSPNHGFDLGLKIQGFNECLVAYILALGSPTHPINRKTYDHWTAGNGYETHDVFGYSVPATVAGGGPLFLAHYSFIGLDPRRMADDEFVPDGYFARNIRQALSNRGYCLYVASPDNRYAPGYWGLIASLIPDGYAANDPLHDTGTVAPTAALASMPYTPTYSRDVLLFLQGIKEKSWGEYGPYDALNLRDDWYSGEYLAIDQLPIACMIENYRSGLLWDLFMSAPEVRTGLAKAGIIMPDLPEGFPEAIVTKRLENDEWLDTAYTVAKHPDGQTYQIPFWSATDGEVVFTLIGDNRQPQFQWIVQARTGRNVLNLPLSPAVSTGAILSMQTESNSVFELLVQFQ